VQGAVDDVGHDAYARGALTKQQLDERTAHALTATVMGDPRAVADGVVELPPALRTGLGPVSVGRGSPNLQVDAALAQVRWRYVGYAAGLVLLGLFLLLIQPVIGAGGPRRRDRRGRREHAAAPPRHHRARQALSRAARRSLSNRRSASVGACSMATPRASAASAGRPSRA
jgi:hypothetical protein